MRAVGRNADRSEVDESIPDPDPETWREIHLSMEGLNRDRLRIELLREQAWLLANAAKLGATIEVEMHELGVSGPATVTYLGPCPEIQPGPGNVIIGRFIHESAGNLLNIRMEGETEPVGVTDNHLYWSVDRKQYIPSGQLRQGERVDTLFGEQTVASIAPRPKDEAVYNLEIHREHVYRVGEAGTLVHNMYAGSAPTTSASPQSSVSPWVGWLDFELPVVTYA